MGAVEEGGKVATGAIDALKGNPALLVLVLLQVATLVAVYFTSQSNAARVQQRELAMLDRCFPLDQEKQ